MQFVEVCAQKTKTPETINKIFLNNQNEQKYEKGIIGIQLKNVQIMKVKFCWHSWKIQGKFYNLSSQSRIFCVLNMGTCKKLQVYIFANGQELNTPSMVKLQLKQPQIYGFFRKFHL